MATSDSSSERLQAPFGHGDMVTCPEKALVTRSLTEAVNSCNILIIFNKLSDIPLAGSENERGKEGAVGEESHMELHLPSKFGSEKVAMSAAAVVAKDMGFPDDRIEDLKTAISEACCNAIEHGNELDESATVMIVLKVGESKLHVAVHDEGRDIGEVLRPDIEKKIEGEDEKRGWGMFLIDGLVNEVNCVTKPEGGKVVELVVILEK